MDADILLNNFSPDEANASVSILFFFSCFPTDPKNENFRINYLFSKFKKKEKWLIYDFIYDS